MRKSKKVIIGILLFVVSFIAIFAMRDAIKINSSIKNSSQNQNNDTVSSNNNSSLDIIIMAS